MGRLTLRLSIGAAALLFASGAPAQVKPWLERAASQDDQVLSPRPGWTAVAVRDRAGNAIIIAYLDVGPPGFRPIEFRDADGRLINKLGKGAPPAPSSPGAMQNPLSGERLPNLVFAPMGGGDGKADSAADMNYLRAQVANLNKQVKLLTDRLNAAAAR